MDWVLVDYQCLLDKDDYSILYIHFSNVINNIYLESVNSFMKNLKENIKKVISEIPKEKYENIFKGAYERPENMFQRIKQGK